MAHAETDIYQPAAGVTGKLYRLRARTGARRLAPVRLTRGIVSVSFDDFPKSAVAQGAAALEAAGARGAFYAATGMAGANNHHGAMFEADDLARLREAGHEIGAHTHDHWDCRLAAAGDVVANIERNLAALKAMGHAAPVRSFAFPYGEASPGKKRILEDRFTSLRGVHPGVATRHVDLNLLPAIGFGPDDASIDSVMRGLELAARRRGWVNIFTHDVCDDPTPWGCTPAQLHRILDAARALGLEILPVGETVERLTESRPPSP